MTKRISKGFEAYSEESLQKSIEQYAHDNDLNIICAVGTKVVKKTSYLNIRFGRN